MTLNPLHLKKELVKQDDLLYELEKGVDRLKVNSKEINNELKSQNKSLDKLENDIDNNNDTIKNTNNILSKYIKEKECNYYFIIFVLFCILIMAIMLVIYA
jgi:hypothetical protein